MAKIVLACFVIAFAVVADARPVAVRPATGKKPPAQPAPSNGAPIDMALELLDASDSINYDTLDLDIPFLIFAMGGPLRKAFDNTIPNCMPWIEKTSKLPRFAGNLNDLYDELASRKNDRLNAAFLMNCAPSDEALENIDEDIDTIIDELETAWESNGEQVKDPKLPVEPQVHVVAEKAAKQPTQMDEFWSQYDGDNFFDQFYNEMVADVAKQ